MATGDKIVVTGLQNQAGKTNNELTTDGTDAYWSPFRITPDTLSTDYTITAGQNATIGSFTLEDGHTITVETGARMIVV